MATLVCDIETVGELWNDLDSVTQESLTRWIRTTSLTDVERDRYMTHIKNGLGFSPFTGMIVAIGLYDIEREQGVVYYQGDTDEEDAHKDFMLKCRSEEEMLEGFWEGVKDYDTFVTFNGRGFDVPFLLIRSLVYGISPTRNLMDRRYLSQQRGVQHVDLQDQLTFYGVIRKKPSLHLVCRALGITSPKEGGVTGDDVTELFHMKKFRDIATYNAEDVIATASVYRRWKKIFYGSQQQAEYF